MTAIIKDIHHRPPFITNEIIEEYKLCIVDKEQIDKFVSLLTDKQKEIVYEVIYAGVYLALELRKLNCPEELIFRTQFTAGEMSAEKNTWDVSQEIIEAFKKGEIIDSENFDDLSVQIDLN